LRGGVIERKDSAVPAQAHRHARHRARRVALFGIGLVGAYTLGGYVLPAQPVHAGSTTTIWIQTMDSCKQSLGQSQFEVTDGASFDVVVTTPSSPLKSVASGGCPLQHGNCSTTKNGCVQVAGLPLADSFHIRETALPPANSGNPLGYAPCNGGSACQNEYDNFTVSSSGAVSANTTNVYPSGTIAVYPNTTPTSFDGSTSNPIVFHDFGLGSGSCDGDSDADDHMTGTPGSHCGYPEAQEASACQPYPWSCTLPSGATYFMLSNPVGVVAGVPFNETITAVDSHNSVVTTYKGQKTLSWSGPSKSATGKSPIYPANPVTFTSGVVQVAITLTDAQTTSLSVSDGSTVGSVPAVVVSGNTATKLTLTKPSSVTAGTPFTETVKALDSYGNAAGYSGPKTLTWTGPSPSPTTPPAYPANPVTFASGASTVSITLYDVQTTTLSVSDGTSSGATSSFAVATPGANYFALSIPAAQTAGIAFSETVTALDQWANKVTGYTGTKTLTWSGPSNSPNLTAPSYPTTLSFSSGVGTATIKLYDAQTTTLTATQGTLKGTSGSFAVGPAAMSAISLATPSAPTAGTPFTETLGATDTYGNGIASASVCVTFTGPASSPHLNAPAYPAAGPCAPGQSSVAVAGGTASLAVTLFDAQSTVLHAATGSLTAATATFTVAAAPTSLLGVAAPGTPTAGTAFTETLSAGDAYGNPVTGTLCVTFSGPGNSPKGNLPAYPAAGGCGTGVSSVTFSSSGSATASITLFDAQTIAIGATVGSVNGSTGSFTVNPGAAASFTVPTPGVQTAAIGFTETITAYDQWGNAATGYSGTPSITGPHPSPKGTGPAYGPMSFSSAVAFVSITLYDAETTSLTVSDGTVSGNSGTFSVNAALFQLGAANPGLQTAGAPFNLSLTATDSYNNALSGSVCVTFSGPSNSPSSKAAAYPPAGTCGTGESSVTFSSTGSATVPVTLFDAQTTSITATQGSLTGATGNFTVDPAAAAAFTVPNPGAQTAGTAFTETITALDQWGNAATGYSGAPLITGSHMSPNGTTPAYGAVSFSNAVASVSITLYDAETTSLIVGDGTVSGNSGTFTVNAAPFQLGVANPGLQSAGVPFNLSLTSADTYGNAASGTVCVTFSGPSISLNSTAPFYPPAGTCGAGESSVTFSSTGSAAVPVTLFDAQTTSVTATEGSQSGATGDFTVNPGVASTFAVPAPGTQNAGTTFIETIGALDLGGNTATSYNGTPTISGPDSSPAPSNMAPAFTGTTFANGIASVSITLYDAESTSLTATDGAISGSSATFTVNPGSTASLSVTLPATATAGLAVSVTAQALDTWSNLNTGDGSTLPVLNSDTFSTPVTDYPIDVSLTAGQVTFAVTFQPDPTQLPGTTITQTITVGPDGAVAAGQGSTSVTQ
jgi:hypothetical protein